VDFAKRRLKEAPEKSLRDVKREKIESIIKSIDNLQRRNVSKEAREKDTETLKLEVCLMCLKSNYLERRIQGIRDLNQIIRNNRMMSTKSLSNSDIVAWLNENQVFSILFDTKKTHLQIVQRCAEILKLLLSEGALTISLLDMFWNLSKSDYKFEVYKIINETSFFLKQEHINYIFDQIKQIPPEKLAMEEFQCLSELGKYARDEHFKENVGDFFWKIICHSENYKDELVTICINRFCEMVKNWDL
jgi:ubiquitin carboxyl-terminal hydrolase 34